VLKQALVQTTAEEELQLPIRRELSDKPQRFTVWRDFEIVYAELKPFGFLVNAVRGFFENDGRLCYVQLIGFRGDSQQQALEAGLKTLEIFNDYDLVCVPDLVYQALPSGQADLTQLTTMQRWVIGHCDAMGDRVAILDSLPPDSEQTVEEQRKRLQGNNGALYYPWLQVPDGPTATTAYVPPCGHVAGIIAQTDRRIGVYKAPANEAVDGILDLQVKLNDIDQSPLNYAGINCLRSFPRRGIRIWGARTLSHDPNWRYINVRRIFTTAARWIERNMADVVFEPNTPELWARIVRDLTFYFSDLLEQGALAGRSAGEAFYVKCNAETNPPETREVGQVITEIGLAVDVPAEFIVVRIMHGMTGVRIIRPA
jgi:phage tail sheath protein FI